MQDEELDKIINDAASQHHPAYDDEAWDKMQVLLNKHMPQKKDRRKPFIFWLLFLLLGGAAVTLLLQHNRQNSTVNKSATGGTNTTAYNAQNTPKNVTEGNTPTNSYTPIDKTNPVTPKHNTTVANTVQRNINNTNITQPAANSSNSVGFSITGKPVLHKKERTTAKTKKATPVSNDDYNDFNNKPKKYAAKTKATVKAAAAYEDEEKNTGEIDVAATNKETAVKKDSTADTALITAKQKATITVKPETAATNTAAQKQRSNKKFTNNFVLTISAGVDKSFIQTANTGKTKIIYGIGAGYILNSRLKVNTGFFASRKVYDAEPADYKFPAGTQYPNLWKINADCMVYEIPVNFYYSFTKGKKHQLFGGAGVSSVIMKKERYNYNYKTPSGQYYSYEHTYANKNKHLFAVATLSGGYQYNLNNRFQFIAEPYFKMPLSGIGAGAVNLKSGGILFTAAVKPFAKK